jgi:hypothetical protein
MKPFVFRTRLRSLYSALIAFGLIAASFSSAAATLDPAAIGKAAGVDAKAQPDGAIKIGWMRTDVPVTVDGMRLSPAAGLGTWASFVSMGDQAMVMGDTVVFQDEVDAAIDAAFAHGLSVSGLHNHFFYDQPKVYFMHIGGEGAPPQLASGVKAVWDAVKAVRAASAKPTEGFGGATPVPGKLDAESLASIVGHPAPVADGVAKITIGREGQMHGHTISGSMGLTTWAAFSGSDDLAVVDGDIIMKADEVGTVLKALRKAGFHIVALHNHMMGEAPAYFFTHFWGKGKAADLAHGFRSALDAQTAIGKR